jgi:protein-S-isoprenylcysteine O-methyltransferase Ste14
MYLGMALTVAGLGLLTDVGWLLVSALAAALIVDRAVIPREEAYLERRFGAAYDDYRRRVRRWL